MSSNANNRRGHSRTLFVNIIRRVPMMVRRNKSSTNKAINQDNRSTPTSNVLLEGNRNRRIRPYNIQKFRRNILTSTITTRRVKVRNRAPVRFQHTTKCIGTAKRYKFHQNTSIIRANTRGAPSNVGVKSRLNTQT